MSAAFPEFVGATGSTRAWVDAMRVYCREIEQRLDYVISQCESLRAENLTLSGQVHSLRNQMPEMAPATEISVSTNTTLATADLNQVLVVNCTSASTLTLPTATNGAWLLVHNRGTQTLTISNGSDTVCVLPQNRGAEFRVTADSSGNVAWPSHVQSKSRDGFAVQSSQLVIDNATAGLALKDSAGHYWTLVFDTTGALVSTDQGTTFAAATGSVPE